jgi:type IV secretory pathway VirB2 component (pilin)
MARNRLKCIHQQKELNEMKKQYVGLAVLTAVACAALIAPDALAQVSPFDAIEEQGNTIVDFLFGPFTKIIATALFFFMIGKYIYTKKMELLELLVYIIGIILLGIGPDVVEFFLQATN